MSSITICDLEVRYRVGVPDEERAHPQRLLLTLELETDFSRCAATDDVTDTIDYYEVTQVLLGYGKGRSWRTIEKLASDIASTILERFRPRRVSVEVRKFIIPETRYVSVRFSRNGPDPAGL